MAVVAVAVAIEMHWIPCAILSQSSASIGVAFARLASSAFEFCVRLSFFLFSFFFFFWVFFLPTNSNTRTQNSITENIKRSIAAAMEAADDY